MKWTATKQIGRILGRKGRWAEAERAFERYVASGGHDNGEALYYLANAKLKLEKLEDALPFAERAVELCGDRADWAFRLGALYERAGRIAEAADAFAKAVELRPDAGRWHYRLARMLSVTGRSPEVLRHLRTAVELAPNDTDIRKYYVAEAIRRGATWQVIDALQRVIEIDPNTARWFHKLGDALAEASRLDEAVASYGAAKVRGDRSAKLSFSLGHCLYRCGKMLMAEEAFADAVEKHTDPAVKRFGPGVFFQRRGLWPEAAVWYERWTTRRGSDAALWYRLGMAYDRSYDWAAAEKALYTAIALKSTVPNWHYRLGLVRERMADWNGAATAYEHAVEVARKPVAYWRYRLGFVLAQAGRHAEAVEGMRHLHASDDELQAFDQAASAGGAGSYLRELLEHGVEMTARSQNATACYARAEDCITAGELRLAEEALLEAVRRDGTQNPRWHHRLGLVQAALGNEAAAVESFLSTRAFRRPDGVSTAGYFSSKNLHRSMQYVEYMETLPVDENVVLYESYFGGRVDCNPLAVFRAVSSDPRFSHMRHVWVVTKATEVPAAVRGNRSVILVNRGSTLYRRYMATAKYLVNNVTFPHWFVRRPEQRYLNTWHGTPLKTLGKDIRTGFMEHANVTRNFLQATHMLAPNEHTEWCLVDQYDIRGLYSGTIARTGAPRIDAMLNAGPEETAALRARLGITDPLRKVVFYAPTWRGSADAKHFDAEKLQDDLARMASLDAVVLFRAHHMTEALLRGVKLDALVVPSSIDTYDVLAITDVLVTDYSSIFFDFLPLNRPVVFYAHDVEEYSAERGLYFDMNDMPGEICRDIDALAAEIERALQHGVGDPARHAEAVERFAPAEDGASAARVVDYFFAEDQTHVVHQEVTGAKTLVMHQSLLPNGITSSFLNLLHQLDPAEYRVVFLFDPAPLERDPKRMEKFLELPGHVLKVARVGGHLTGLEERWVIDKFKQQHRFASQEQAELYRRAFQREHRRLFGDTAIDASIEFDGYASFWMALMAAETGKTRHRVAYLHNRMFQEWNTKYSNLKGTFALYHWYEKLVSVSKVTGEVNRAELAEWLRVPADRFDFAENLMRPERIKEMARKPLDADIAEFMAGASEVWVTIGRMSPEKGHIKLLEAFSVFLNERPGARLVLFGEGPLRGDTEAAVDRLGLASSVLLAGHRSNPFPALAHADAFILASDHEGQPMVLLEALTLGVPPVATNIAGSRSVLGAGYGLLVENSVEGVVRGFREGISHEPTAVFDIDRYQEFAMWQFQQVTDGKAEPNLEPAQAF